MLVLIVEDEYLVSRMTAEVLTVAGHTVVGIVGSVDQAVQFILGTEFDAAIVDANLKGLCAVDVGAALRERGIPFVVTTGYARPQLRGALRDAPFLKKPVAPSTLIASLDALLAEKK